MGEHTWLTVVSPESGRHRARARAGDHPAVSPFKAALVHDGIPFTSRGRRRRERARATRRARCAFHTTTHRDGPGYHRGVRRHVRQSHPDRSSDLNAAGSLGGTPNRQSPAAWTDLPAYPRPRARDRAADLPTRRWALPSVRAARYGLTVGADGLRTEAEALTDAGFTEPWRAVPSPRGRAANGLGVPWDDSASADGCDRGPPRSYYESWLVALERLAVDTASVTPQARHATHARSLYRTDEAGHDDLEVFPWRSASRCWSSFSPTCSRTGGNIRFGPLINGAVYELLPPHRPRLSMLDGYLTIGFEQWHVHLCVGEHQGPPDHPVDAGLARRRCARRVATQFVEGAPELDVSHVQRRAPSSSRCCSRTPSWTATAADRTARLVTARALGCPPPALPRSAF